MRSRYEIYEKERGRVLTTIPRLLHQLELQSISYIVRMNHFNVNELSTGTDLEILKNWAQNQQLVWRKEGGSTVDCVDAVAIQSSVQPIIDEEYKRNLAFTNMPNFIK